MKKILFLFITIATMEGFGQTLISKTPGAVPNPDALLEVRTQFSSPRGFLMPSATFGQISGNLFPRIDNTINVSFDNNGLLIYASDSGRFMYFRDDYNAFTLLNPWTLNAGGSILSYNAPGITGFGLGTSSPFSFMDVAGGVTVGSGYAGNNAAPSDGLLVEGKTVIGTTVIDPDPDVMLQVEGDMNVSGANISSTLSVLGKADLSDSLTVGKGIKVENGGISASESVVISGEGDYRYSSPKRKTLIIPFTDFKVNTEGDWVYGDYLQSRNILDAVAKATIRIPDLATITSATVWCEDGNSNGSISCRIKQATLNGETSVVDFGSTSGSASDSNYTKSLAKSDLDLTTSYSDLFFYYCECTISVPYDFTVFPPLPIPSFDDLGVKMLHVEYTVRKVD